MNLTQRHGLKSAHTTRAREIRRSAEGAERVAFGALIRTRAPRSPLRPRNYFRSD